MRRLAKDGGLRGASPSYGLWALSIVRDLSGPSPSANSSMHCHDNEEMQMNRGIKSRAIAFCLLTAVVVSSSPAQAKTIYLVCDTITYTVDLINKTVNNVPATINTTAFDWQKRTDYGGGIIRTWTWHIDRAAGAITTTLSTHFANGHVAADTATRPCKVSSAPSTKF